MSKNKIITGCPKCGKNSFLITESIVRRAAFDEGALDAFGIKDNSIDMILCDSCEYEFTPAEIAVLTVNF
jgi:predicted nucleic-acid-binding Zn-ribbon protein